jgi:hypothetical protein
MKITLSALKSRGPLPKVAIRSTELSLYLAEIELDGKPHIICDDDETPLRTVNLVAMRERLQGLDMQSLVLVQDSAYDEMIGQPAREGGNRLEVPLETGTPWLH